MKAPAQRPAVSRWMACRFLAEGPGVPEDAPRKTGLSLFAETVRREWWELIRLNLVFILFSLPLVTLPAAQLAVTRVCVAMIEHRNYYTLREFCEAFRARFASATLVGCALAVGMSIASLALAAFARMASLHLVFSVPVAVALSICVLLPLYGAHLFVLLARRPEPLRRVLRPAFLGLLARPAPAAVALVFVIALWSVQIVFYPISFFVTVTFNFSLGTLAMTFAVHGGASRTLSPDEVSNAAVLNDRRRILHAS